MISLGEASITVDGVSVFTDHNDPNQFWYLPGPVRLSRNEEGVPVLTLLRYRSQNVSEEVAGGFLMLGVNLTLSEETERVILSRLQSLVEKGEPKLAAVPFNSGAVQCMALDLQGSGGTTAEPPEDGRAPMAETIFGAKTPSLFGDNSAIFNVVLSKDGTDVIEQALRQGASSVGVIYELQFAAVRPNLHVKITADYERIYDHLSGGVEGNVYMVKGAIEAGFEELKEEKAIEVEVVDFTDEEDRENKESQAMEFFKNQLLNDLFTPTLELGKLKDAPETGLDDLSAAAASIANAAESAGDEAKPVQVAFKLKFLRQEERRIATYEYNRSGAVTRTYAPQAFVGLLARDLENLDRHIVDTVLRNFTVRVRPPALDFQRYGLQSVDVELFYEDPNEPGADQRGHASFESTQDPTVEREFAVNSTFDVAYDYSVTYNFVAGDEWEGEQFEYSLPKRKTTDLSLSPNPFDDIGFLEIEVKPNEMDPELVKSTEVHLRYEGPPGFSREKTLVVERDSGPQLWKLRLSDPEARTFHYRLVHRLVDGSTRQGEEVETDTPTVMVNDPFDRALDIQVFPLFDTDEFAMVFVDLEYQDPVNDYVRSENFQLEPDENGKMSRPTVRIPLLNPDRREYTYSLTWVGTDNDLVEEGPFTENAERIVVRAPQA